MNPPRIGFARLLLLAVLANLTAQAIHETGHMLVYQAYSRTPTWGFTGLAQLWGTPPINPNEWAQTVAPDGERGWLRVTSLPSSRLEKALGASAGPLASLLSVLAGLWIAYKSNRGTFRSMGLMLALLVSFIMALYYLRSPMRGFGDEYEMARQLGVAKWGVEIPLALMFGGCFIAGYRLLFSRGVRMKWLAAILAGSIPTGILLTQADHWVRAGVNRGDAIFQPVLGYSLPVFVVYALTFLGAFLWERGTTKLLPQS